MTIETIERDGYRVRIEPDPSPTSPREYTIVHALTIDTHAGSYLPVDQDGGPFAEKWERIAWRKDAVDLFKRYARIYHGAVVVEHRRPKGPVTLWYLTGEQIEKVAIRTPEEYIEADIREYEQWADGEVYGYTVEKRVAWKRCGTSADDEQYLWTWERVDDLWDLVGLEHARSEAHSALSQAIAGQWEKSS